MRFFPGRARYRFVLLYALSLLGCAPTLWSKPGATQQDWATDSYVCERDARQSGHFGGGIVGAVNLKSFYERCLVSKGYQQQAREGGTSQSPRQNKDDFMAQARQACALPPHIKPVEQCIQDYETFYDAQHR